MVTENMNIYIILITNYLNNFTIEYLMVIHNQYYIISYDYRVNIEDLTNKIIVVLRNIIL